jgi:tetrahydromethanopterin S-methyltransferase subunit G
VSESHEIEARLTRVEARVEEVAEEAAAARHLAAFHDRDLADLGVKVDANRKAINALGIQTAARFERLEGRFDRLEKKVDDEFADVRAEMRAGFAQADANFAQINRNFAQVDQNFLTIRGLLDATAAAQQRTAELLTTLIEQRGDR